MYKLAMIISYHSYNSHYFISRNDELKLKLYYYLSLNSKHNFALITEN